MFKHTNNKEISKIFFKDSEWGLLVKLYRVFEVFLRPSKDLQGQTYITNLFSLLYVYQMFNKLNKLAKAYVVKTKVNYNIALTHYLIANIII